MAAMESFVSELCRKLIWREPAGDHHRHKVASNPRELSENAVLGQHALLLRLPCSLHLALLGPRAWSSEALAGRLAPIRLHFSSSEPPKPSPGDTVKQLLVYRILSSLVPGGIGRSRFGPLYRNHVVCAATCGSTGITGGLGSVRNTAVCFRTLGLRSNYSVDRGWV